MNRRAFFKNSTAAAAGVGSTMVLGKPAARGQATGTGFNSWIYTNCNAALAMAAGLAAVYDKPQSPAPWHACSLTMAAAYTDFVNNNYSAQIAAAAGQITPSMIRVKT